MRSGLAWGTLEHFFAPPSAPSLAPPRTQKCVKKVSSEKLWGFLDFGFDFFVLSAHNYGMAKLISGAKITVETPTERYEFDAPTVGVSSTNWGRTHDLCVVDALNMVKTDLRTPKEAPVPTEAPTTASGLTKEQEAGLNAVLASAKQIERQQFVSARAVERAVLDAEQGKAVVQHDFNMAVLEGLHTGLSQEDIAIHLLKAGFSQLEMRVDDIQTLNTDLLYETEA